MTGVGVGMGLGAAPKSNDAQHGNQPTTQKYEPIVHTLPKEDTEKAYYITSLATGIKSKSLATLLKNAEEQMRAGKFTSALDTYDAAAQVAPNNPFITLGRSFSELGASYYTKADGDLRNAIRSEPALLVGQYDLKGFIGDSRLSFIIKDLTDISTSESKSPRAPFLLGYIYYNLADKAKATEYMNTALQRSGGSDPVIQQIQESWGLQK